MKKLRVGDGMSRPRRSRLGRTAGGGGLVLGLRACRGNRGGRRIFAVMERGGFNVAMLWEGWVRGRGGRTHGVAAVVV